jgi:hypothetical protein
VEVRIEDVGDGLHKWIIVEDNGVGMSQRILTGPLIDFGHSLWRSPLVKEMLPGFASKHIEQIGRYGIGFYSTNMVSDSLTVSSRPYKSGLESVATVSFPNGLLEHGLLIKGSNEPMGINISTRVKMKVKTETIKSFLRVRTSESFYEEPSEDCPVLRLDDRLEILCIALDCDIYSRDEASERVLAHRADWQNIEPKPWLDRLLLAKVQSGKGRFERVIEIAARTLREVKDGNICRGRAAITFATRPGLEFEVVQGFCANHPSVSRSGPMSLVIGFIESTSAGPRRRRKDYRVSRESLVAWASEQAVLLASCGLNPEEAHSAAINAARFGGAISPIANLFINGELKELDEIAKIICRGHALVVPLHKYNREREGDRIGNVLFNLGDFLSIPRNYVQLSQEIPYLGESLQNNSSDFYYRLRPDKEEQSTFIGALRSHLNNLGVLLSIDVHEEFDLGTYVGHDMPDREIFNGMRIVQGAALLRSQDR